MIHNGSEDSIISHFLSCIHPWPLISQIDKTRIDWSTSPFCDKQTIAGHYGYINNGEMFTRVNSVLDKQNKTPIDLDEMTSSKFIADFKSAFQTK